MSHYTLTYSPPEPMPGLDALRSHAAALAMAHARQRLADEEERCMLALMDSEGPFTLLSADYFAADWYRRPGRWCRTVDAARWVGLRYWTGAA